MDVLIVMYFYPDVHQKTPLLQQSLSGTVFPCLAAAMSEPFDSLREALIGRISSTDDNQILQLQKEDGTLHLQYNVSLCDPQKVYKFIRVPFAERIKELDAAVV
jgi:hypothetical protein